MATSKRVAKVAASVLKSKKSSVAAKKVAKDVMKKVKK